MKKKIKKVSTRRKYEMHRDTKDLMTVVFIFSLILGIILTTYLASQALGVNVTQAAGLH